MTAPFNYADMVAVADELMQEFGRQVTFIKNSTTPADSAKPWRTENLALSTQLNGVLAAVVPFMSEDDKDAVRYGIKMVLVSGSSFPGGDGQMFDGMIDSDGSYWHLHDATVINPGGTVVFYQFKAEQ